MKVLIVCSNDISGGAAIASYRLHRGLLANGISSTMIVQKKHSGDDSVVQCSDEWDGMSSVYERMHLFPYPQKSNTLFSSASISNTSLVNYINNSGCDIVHLHWINNGFIKIIDLLNIRKPIVWTLHDMWPFTGGCHYDEWCGRYKLSCGICKVLRSKDENDLSRQLSFEKKHVFSMLKKITFIGLSKWIANEAIESSLLKGKKIVNIPNPLDNRVYKVVDKKQSRYKLGFSLDKKIILFGAVNSTVDIRKGGVFFQEIISSLSASDYEFVIFGNTCNEKIENSNVHYLGHVSDEATLVNVYNSADVMIVPSLQENLANTIVEALFCGVPVVAFNIGGNADMIDHKINGYLAKPFLLSSLVDGVIWCLKNTNLKLFNKNISKSAQDKFSVDVVVPRYIDLYSSVVSSNYDDHELVFHNNNRLKFIPKHIDDYLLHLATQSSKYVVYGAGNYGKAMLDYFSSNIVAFIDKGCDRVDTKIKKHEVYSPKCLCNMEFDKIIIGALGYEDEVEVYLVGELGVSKDKIIRIL